MDAAKSRFRWKYLFGTVLIFLLFSFSWADADDSVTVICYLGDPDQNVRVGTVDIFDTSSAARACNSAYNVCRGNCTGCFLDMDGQEYCYDNEGRRFQR